VDRHFSASAEASYRTTHQPEPSNALPTLDGSAFSNTQAPPFGGSPVAHPSTAPATKLTRPFETVHRFGGGRFRFSFPWVVSFPDGPRVSPQY